MTCHLCPSTEIVARGLCRRCWSRLEWRRRNNPDTWTGWPYPRLLRPRAKGLKCDMCRSEVYARGLCRNHYRQMSRRRIAA